MPVEIDGEQCQRLTTGAAPLDSARPVDSFNAQVQSNTGRTGPCPATPAPQSTKPTALTLWFGSLAVLLLLGSWLVWLCHSNPNVNFLPEDHPAHWILPPRAPTAGVQLTLDTAATFRHTLALESRPRSAMLCWRAFKSCALLVNGEPLDLPSGNKNWKETRKLELAPWLRAGTNTISVTVSNHAAPPALWFSLSGPGVHLISDTSWEVNMAGTWRAALLATGAPQVAPANLLAGQERTLWAFARSWPRLVVLALFSTVIVFGAARWFRSADWQPHPDRPGGLWWRNDPALVLFVVIAVLQICLLGHNLARLPQGAGFDAYGHLDYVEYIQSHAGLPLANQGWEMHQPPLYYLICAATLNCLGLSATNDNGVRLLRWVSLLIGLVHTGLILALLRLLFPKQRCRQAVGLAVAGFVPMQLYLAQYPTNESLAACLMAAALYLSLRLLQQGSGTPGFSDCAALGVYAGLALLTKVTALVILPFGLIALVYACRKVEPGRWRRVLLPLSTGLVFLAVCGWHYGRVWRHFGTPFFPVTHWAYGISWWQDPGYRTARYFLGFGRSLSNPFFSGISSFLDGLYSTCWGDGLCGGAGVLRERPPWNYQLMAAGFILALLPTLLIAGGLIRRLWQLRRRFEPGWVLLITFSFAMWLALLYLNLMVPSYAVAKSFYSLGALGAVCALAAAGWELVEKSTPLSLLTGIALTTWGLVAYLSFWSPGPAPTAEVPRGLNRPQAFLPAATKQMARTPRTPNQLARGIDRL